MVTRLNSVADVTGGNAVFVSTQAAIRPWYPMVGDGGCYTVLAVMGDYTTEWQCAVGALVSLSLYGAFKDGVGDDTLEHVTTSFSTSGYYPLTRLGHSVGGYFCLLFVSYSNIQAIKLPNVRSGIRRIDSKPPFLQNELGYGFDIKSPQIALQGPMRGNRVYLDANVSTRIDPAACGTQCSHFGTRHQQCDTDDNQNERRCARPHTRTPQSLWGLFQSLHRAHPEPGGEEIPKSHCELPEIKTCGKLTRLPPKPPKPPKWVISLKKVSAIPSIHTLRLINVFSTIYEYIREYKRG